MTLWRGRCAHSAGDIVEGVARWFEMTGRSVSSDTAAARALYGINEPPYPRYPVAALRLIRCNGPKSGQETLLFEATAATVAHRCVKLH